jgi:predicted lipoprotein with Yx(FWY)xxD motif
VKEHRIESSKSGAETNRLQEIIIMRHPSALAATTLAVLGLAVAGCGSSGSSSSGKTEASGYPATSTSTPQSTTAPAAASTGGATVLTTEHTSLGTILAAGPKRLTVYLFAADTGSTSKCSGACAEVWPPVTTTGTPKAEGGAMAADLGTTARPEGTRQVTYKGHPLYYYVSDRQAGETGGQGLNSFGAPWWVLSPSGSQITGS